MGVRMVAPGVRTLLVMLLALAAAYPARSAVGKASARGKAAGRVAGREGGGAAGAGGVHSEGVHLLRGSLDVRSEPHHPAVRGKRNLAEMQAAWGGGGRDSRWGKLAGKEQVLVTLSHPLTDAKQRKLVAVLEAHGGHLGEYVPSNSFLAVASPEAAEALAELESVLWVGEFRRSYKLSPELDDLLATVDRHWGIVHTQLGLNASVASVTGGKIQMVRGTKMGEVSVRLARPAAPRASRGGNGTQDAGAAAAAEWPALLCEGHLPAGLRDGCQVGRAGADRAYVVAELAALPAVLDFLSAHPMVTFVEPRATIRLFNYYASSITQSGTVGDSTAARPIWAAGLTGEGQLVGCGDTGIDYDHCSFRDTVNPIGSSHRKVHYYRSYVDGYDQGFHGTHVVGTVLGSSGSSWDGMAPDAKVGFTDIGGDTGLEAPSRLDTAYYQYAYDRGVRIHTDSWGGISTSYNFQSADVDEFHFENQDFLGIFAAGNDGGAAGVGTVSVPATAKNPISVGASLTGIPGMNQPYQEADVWQMSLSGGDLDGETFRIMQAHVGAPTWAGVGSMEVVVSEPAGACSPLSNTAAVAGKLVLVIRGADDPEELDTDLWCYFTEKVRNALAAGAAAVLVANNGDDGYIEIGAPSTDPGTDLTSIPVGSIPKSTWRLLRGELTAGRPVAGTVTAATLPEDRWDNMATFSSIGPTRDGRFKPDILAPGEDIRSARSDQSLSTGNCGTTLLSGTSMAAPVVAGSAALVRQYFTDGYYPSGLRGGSPARTPSGALIKAVLLNGAYPLEGFTEAGYPLDLPPSYRQGYGRVHLQRSLPLSGVSSPLGSMHVVESSLSATGQRYNLCIQLAEGDRDLRATLVWHDPPSAAFAASNLVNDLDLVLRTSSLVTARYGNGEEGDRTNNAEQVAIRRAAAGSWSLEVSAHRISSSYGAQPFALVVHGAFSSVTEGGCADVPVEITSGPSGLSASRSASFGFGPAGVVAPAGTAYECKLTDGAGSTGTVSELHDWEACTSPRAYTSLPDLTYSFWARAVGGIHVLADFQVDATTPTTALVAPLPLEILPGDAVAFFFQSSDTSEVTHQCLLEGPAGCAACGAWAACTSPHAYTSMPDGSFTFSVRGTDAAGNQEAASSVPSRAFSVDVTAPSTIITSSPGPLVAEPSLTFAFSSQAGDAVEYECSLVARFSPAQFSACASPVAYPGLADGAWEFAVRGADETGNWDSSPETWTGAIDTQPPVLALSTAPGALTTSSAATFTIAVSSDEDIEEIQLHCRLSGPGQDASAPDDGCLPVMSFLRLPEGAFSFSYYGMDEAGNPSAVQAYDFTVDRTAPVTTLQAPLPASPSTETSASIAFASEDAVSAGVTLECKLDTPTSGAEGAWVACTSPYALSDMEGGAWAFSARGTDEAGNVEQDTAPVHTWVVDLSAPVTVLAATPARIVAASAASYEFGSEEGGEAAAGFECSLMEIVGGTIPDPQWAECTSPASYSLLADGIYEFSVRAYDAAGNHDGFFPRHIVTVDTTRPTTTITTPPLALTSAVSISAFFVADEPGVSFKCLVREGGEGGQVLVQAATCSTPYVVQNLPTGEYTFEVLAVDAAGNVGPAASADFEVDRTPPLVEVTAATPTAAMAVSWAAEDPAPGKGVALVECRLAQGLAARADEAEGGVGDAAGELVGAALALYNRWAPCGPSPLELAVPDGRWAIGVRATDEAGNVGPEVERDVLVDSAPPAVTGPGVSLRVMSAAVEGEVPEVNAEGLVEQVATDLAFDFSLPEATEAEAEAGGEAAAAARVVSFECRLTDAAGSVPSEPYHDFRECASPVSYLAVPAGDYYFSFRATDAAGNTSPPSEAAGVAVVSAGSGLGGPMVAVGAGVGGFVLVACVGLVAYRLCCHNRQPGGAKSHDPAAQAVEQAPPPLPPTPGGRHVLPPSVPAPVPVAVGPPAGGRSAGPGAYALPVAPVVAPPPPPPPPPVTESAAYPVGGWSHYTPEVPPPPPVAPVVMMATSNAISVGSGRGLPACDHCGIRFSTEDEVLAHIISVHSTSRHSTPRASPSPTGIPRGAHPGAVCPICQGAYEDLAMLNAHIDRAHGNSEGGGATATATAGLVCPICGIHVPDNPALNQHLDVAHS